MKDASKEPVQREEVPAFLRQFARVLDERIDDRLGVLAADLHQHHVSRLALNQRRDLAVPAAEHQVALPVTSNLSCLDFLRSVINTRTFWLEDTVSFTHSLFDSILVPAFEVYPQIVSVFFNETTTLLVHLSVDVLIYCFVRKREIGVINMEPARSLLW